MTRVIKGVKMIAYPDDGVIIRQRVKILDDDGNLIKAPIMEVRVEKKHDKEPLDEVRKRAEKVLELKLRELVKE